jgi:hypothetical protein
LVFMEQVICYVNHYLTSLSWMFLYVVYLPNPITPPCRHPNLKCKHRAQRAAAPAIASRMNRSKHMEITIELNSAQYKCRIESGTYVATLQRSVLNPSSGLPCLQRPAVVVTPVPI